MTTDWIECNDGSFVRLTVEDDGGNEILADVYEEDGGWVGCYPAAGMDPVNGQKVMMAVEAASAQVAMAICDAALSL